MKKGPRRITMSLHFASFGRVWPFGPDAKALDPGNPGKMLETGDFPASVSSQDRLCQ